MVEAETSPIRSRLRDIADVVTATGERSKLEGGSGQTYLRIAAIPQPVGLTQPTECAEPIEPATATTKGIVGPVAGQANVLIFPDLNSGNIGSELVQTITGANSYGQIITGLASPAVEISRGARAHNILGAAAIVGCQAIDRVLLYGAE